MAKFQAYTPAQGDGDTTREQKGFMERKMATFHPFLCIIGSRKLKQIDGWGRFVSKSLEDLERFSRKGAICLTKLYP